MQHRTCRCPPLEFPRLLLLTSRMTTRGNLYPCSPSSFIPLLANKKKERSIFDSTSSPIESISQYDYFAIIICQDWIKGKKEKNKYEFLIKESMKECGMRIFVAFRGLAVIEWKLNHSTR